MNDYSNPVPFIKYVDRFIANYQDIVVRHPCDAAVHTPHHFAQEVLINTINFMEISSAILAPLPNGEYKLIPRNTDPTFYPVRAATWAPLVDLRAIEVTSWCHREHRRGLWRGREVGA